MKRGIKYLEPLSYNISLRGTMLETQELNPLLQLLNVSLPSFTSIGIPFDITFIPNHHHVVVYNPHIRAAGNGRLLRLPCHISDARQAIYCSAFPV